VTEVCDEGMSIDMADEQNTVNRPLQPMKSRGISKEKTENFFNKCVNYDFQLFTNQHVPLQAFMADNLLWFSPRP